MSLLHRLGAAAGLVVALTTVLAPSASAAAPSTSVLTSTTVSAAPASPGVTLPTPAPTSTTTTGTTAGTKVPSSGPVGPAGPRGTTAPDPGTVNVQLGGLTDKPGTSVSVILAVTLLSLLPALLLTCTSFTKILVVLGLTRNALGLQQTPPNQVLTGLALFLSLFIMGPVLSQMNTSGLQPYMNGTKTSAQAFTDGSKPLKAFMLAHTDNAELQLLTDVAKRPQPKSNEDVELTTLIPAFVLSELKEAFIIGFVIFIPFLVIDIVVSGALMALGMMMMPPVMVSLPFKLLLFVMVDGWALVIKSLVASYT
ncbi:MAG: flagellar type III secretion system pore protein FliP [Actinomycetota bacterium]|nr:flagellar type III secretion system pore protein FliP [Actinomycetota bacterium]